MVLVWSVCLLVGSQRFAVGSLVCRCWFHGNYLCFIGVVLFGMELVVVSLMFSGGLFLLDRRLVGV